MAKLRPLLWLCALAAAVTTADASPLEDLSSGDRGRIEFRSSTPLSRWRLASSLTADQNPVTIWGDLLFPPAVEGKVPAVVISHGSEGVSSLYYDVWAKALLAEGYAVFIVDSQKPRGVAGSLGDKQLTWDTTANISDALHALKLLATHPDIDTSRIFSIGFSRGANAAFAAAWPFYQRGVLPDGLHWAGTVAVYPGCNLRYRDDQWGTNPGPILMLLAEKDDMTPARPCTEYSDILAAAGNRVSHKVYAGAYHVFDRLNQPYARFREGTFAECSIEIKMSIRPVDPFESRDYKSGAEYGSYREWARAVQACGTTKWITVESNQEARRQAVSDALQFLRQPR